MRPVPCLVAFLALATTALAQILPETPPLPDALPDSGSSFVGVDLRDVATRHYYNPFDGLMLDRNPYPEALVDEAQLLLHTLSQPAEASLPAIGPGRLLSARVVEWTPGRMRFLAIMLDGRPYFRLGTFAAATQSVEALEPVSISDPRLFISLRDLTLSLTSADRRFVLVDPVGAGGYRKDESKLLMTPVMRPETTRTPGRACMDARLYRSTYMIASRTHPEYYEGLPFVRLRRFDQPVDEYGIHGPISRGGTFPVRWNLPGEKLAELRFMGFEQSVSPSRLYERLVDQEFIDDESRLVRGRISNGCIRLRARDIRELFAVLGTLPRGAAVTVSYASDPGRAFHPFPWESRRFAVATDEKDEDGLTVMFTGQIRNQAGRCPEVLPFPDAEAIAREEARAARQAHRSSRSPVPARERHAPVVVARP